MEIGVVYATKKGQPLATSVERMKSKRLTTATGKPNLVKADPAGTLSPEPPDFSLSLAVTSQYGLGSALTAIHCRYNNILLIMGPTKEAEKWLRRMKF